MTENELKREYFEWMCQLVNNEPEYRREGFCKLLEYLHTIPFMCTIGMDENRAEDGTDLRYRFGYEFNYGYPAVAAYLDDLPCSVLELMIALAHQCEEQIMDDPEAGNRTGRWFWGMVDSIGLGGMNDVAFDAKYVDKAINKFMNHEYKRNGEGGLFTVKRCKSDMRSVEIYYQMCWYMDEVLESEGKL